MWSAKMCVDAYLKGHLLKMIEYYCYEIEGKDVWHDGRFLDKWSGEAITNELKKCFAHYDATDVRNALLATSNLFEHISREVALKKDIIIQKKHIIVQSVLLREFRFCEMLICVACGNGTFRLKITAKGGFRLC